ncbi:PAS domain-containing protein [Sphingomonas sp. A2-49]|uniref:PAS domain-containing protein n=1 Tax=Sphingomonas sp. A2-49 TaxID=1391375 RepID=UPI0021CF4493|nr:PAS domain-containing protein [Sphingomonas sp. A2-49]MCU6455308.1 PAS domain-containing protein [Sphingomonas sp. A2-49]
MSDSSASERSLQDEQRIALEIAGPGRHTDPFVAAVHATRMPMIITNPRLPDNPVVFANDSFCRLTGYDRNEIVGRNCRFLQGPETDPATVRAIHDAVERVEAIEIDIRNHRKNGEPFWNRLLMAPVFDADEKLVYFFASQVDVTIERERLQGLESDNAALMAELTARLRAQQERERELDFALKAGRFGTWSIDLLNMALTSSDQCKALFGLHPEVPFTFEDRMAAVITDDRERAERALARTIADGVDYEVEYQITTPDGVVRWLASRGQPFFDADGRPVRLAGVSLDITAVKRTERRRVALAELGNTLRDLDDAADISFVAAEVIGRTLEVSRAGYGIVDQDREMITIERDWNAPGIQTIAGVLAFRDYGSYIDDIKRGETAVVEDARIDPRTVATAPALEAISARSFINMPIMEQGEVVALLFVNHDAPRAWQTEDMEFLCEVAERTRTATERRRAERELANLAASLEQQVADRTAELMTAEEALRQSQKMEAVGQLTGGLAHDFNNLLTVIRGSVDLLRRSDVSNDRRIRYIDAIADTADRASRLTSQLLAFARRQALKPEAFDASESVRAIQPMIHTLVGSRITVRMETPAFPCVVNADRSQFDTAIVNMAVNARDAMAGEGALVMAVGRVEGMPAVRSHPAVPGDFVTICVRDTGSGIPPEMIDKIFEPFFTTKGVGEGTGLGLSQVFGFTKQSGGEVVVESDEGRGATFTMYLPASQATMRVDEADLSNAPSLAKGACILVVEDNPEVGQFATDALAEMGYNVVLAADGRTALEKLAADKSNFDVVFSDVVMPGMSGIELGQEIKRLHPNLPVILTSGFSSVLAEGGTHGFELLHKPYSVDELSRTLRKVKDRRALP